MTLSFQMSFRQKLDAVLSGDFTRRWLRSFTLSATSRLLKVLRYDKRMIFQAAAHAQRAADFLQKLQEQKEEAAA